MQFNRTASQVGTSLRSFFHPHSLLPPVYASILVSWITTQSARSSRTFNSDIGFTEQSASLPYVGHLQRKVQLPQDQSDGPSLIDSQVKSLCRVSRLDNHSIIRNYYRKVNDFKTTAFRTPFSSRYVSISSIQHALSIRNAALGSRTAGNPRQMRQGDPWPWSLITIVAITSESTKSDVVLYSASVTAKHGTRDKQPKLETWK